MHYAESLRYLRSAASSGTRMGLERITEILRRLGDPHEQIQAVHISGTNGKGSVGSMLASILTEAGFVTGHFSSPAVTSPLDLFRLNTQMITPELFADTLTDVAACAAQMTDPPTAYELLAAMAYTLFSRSSCDIAVVECCMGGDTDCTNVLRHPLLSVITNVQLDHCNFLGNTVEEIAAHKAGIIKEGCPVLYGGTNRCVLDIIRSRAARLHAPFYTTADMETTLADAVCSLNGLDVTYQKSLHLHLPLLGSYQLENLKTVLQAFEIITEALPVKNRDQALLMGLEKVKWHGRFEILHRDPLILYDGAHNPDGIRMAQRSIEAYFCDRKIALLIGVMADKAYSLYPKLLGRHLAKVFTVKPDNPRALDAAALAEVFTDHGMPAEPFRSLSDGVRQAYQYAKSEQIPLIVLGTLYMYREFCEALQDISET